jgi:hypothetical protein
MNHFCQGFDVKHVNLDSNPFQPVLVAEHQASFWVVCLLEASLIVLSVSQDFVFKDFCEVVNSSF